MTTNDRRLDRIEKAQSNGGPPMPSQWDVNEEIRCMESDPNRQSTWTQERVHYWISELEGEGDETHQP